MLFESLCVIFKKIILPSKFVKHSWAFEVWKQNSYGILIHLYVCVSLRMHECALALFS